MKRPSQNFHYNTQGNENFVIACPANCDANCGSKFHPGSDPGQVLGKKQ